MAQFCPDCAEIFDKLPLDLVKQFHRTIEAYDRTFPRIRNSHSTGEGLMIRLEAMAERCPKCKGEKTIDGVGDETMTCPECGGSGNAE